MNKSTKIVLFFFMGLSLLIGITGIISFKSNSTKMDVCTESVTATVISLKQNGDGSKHHNKPTYAPVFEYDYGGNYYTQEYGISYSRNHKDKFRVGQTYTIYVNPKKPTQFIVEGHENDIDTFAIIGPIMGFLMFGIFLFVFVIVNKKCKKQLNQYTNPYQNQNPYQYPQQQNQYPPQF